VQNWSGAVKSIVKDIKFAQTPLFNGKLPAEIVLSYQPNNQFNKLFQKPYAGDLPQKVNKSYSLPQVGTKVWC